MTTIEQIDIESIEPVDVTFPDGSVRKCAPNGFTNQHDLEYFASILTFDVPGFIVKGELINDAIEYYAVKAED